VPPGTPAFELRLAENQLRTGWTEMPVRGGGTLIVAPQPVLTPAQVNNAALSRDGGEWLIFNVREGSRGTLQAMTGEHTKKWVVFMLDGQAVYAAVLGMPLSRQVAIRIGPDGITDAEAKRCLEIVRAGTR
jgi:preprotein translocase subunit SecD